VYIATAPSCLNNWMNSKFVYWLCTVLMDNQVMVLAVAHLTGEGGDVEMPTHREVEQDWRSLKKRVRKKQGEKEYTTSTCLV